MSPRLLLKLGGLLKGMFGRSERAEEIIAQTEHDDILEYHKTGRISGMHLWLYARVFLAVLVTAVLCVALCAALFSPTAADNLSALLGWVFSGPEGE